MALSADPSGLGCGNNGSHHSSVCYRGRLRSDVMTNKELDRLTMAVGIVVVFVLLAAAQALGG